MFLIFRSIINAAGERMRPMSGLFEQTQINNMTLKNRFVRSATWEGMALKDGSCTPKLKELMAKLARGGVGLIITGHAHIDAAGQASPFQTGIFSDSHIPGLKEVTDAVHNEDGKIVIQIAHAGCQSIAKLTGVEPMGPSVLEIEGKSVCREMSIQEIKDTVTKFAEAAERAQKAGFDGIEIHGAHSYLLNQFLSPYYNKRTDEYGGSLENRSRFAIESYRAIRNTVGTEFPVIIKLNSEDFLDNGFALEEMIEVANMLQQEGIDAIELSGGAIQSDRNHMPVRPGKLDAEDKEAYYRNAAKQYKEKITTPLILVGGIRSFTVAEKLVNEGITDYISLSRPLIREPNLINRWQSGDHSKSECKSDNACFRPGLKGEGIYCVVREKEEGVRP